MSSSAVVGMDGTVTTAKKKIETTAKQCPEYLYSSCVAACAAMMAYANTAWQMRCLALVVCAYVGGLLYQNRRRPGEPPVVWSWVPVLGSAVAFGAAPLAFLKTSAEALGSPVFVATVAGERTAFVADPGLWPRVLREPAGRLEFRSTGMDVTEGAFGVARADVADAFADATDRVAHQQFVRCLQKPEHLRELTAAAAAALEQSLAALAGRRPLFEALAAPLWVATMRALTGDSSFATPACFDDFKAFDGKFAYLAGGAPAAAFPAAASALARVADRYRTDPLYASGDATVSALLRSRRQLFARCEAEAGRPWRPDSHGRIQATMVWASAANTIPAALWTAYWLARDAAARRRVVADVAAGLRGAASVAEALEDDGAFPVLDGAISEALRLATASLTVRRVVVGDYVLPGAGCRLRRRDRVALYPPLVHFDAARVGADPETFVLDRYLANPRTPLMPFGGGISLCPGRIFARREIKAFLAVLLSRYDVALADPAAPVPPSDPSRVGLGIIGPAPGADVDVVFSARA